MDVIADMKPVKRKHGSYPGEVDIQLEGDEEEILGLDYCTVQYWQRCKTLGISPEFINLCRKHKLHCETRINRDENVSTSHILIAPIFDRLEGSKICWGVYPYEWDSYKFKTKREAISAAREIAKFQRHIFWSYWDGESPTAYIAEGVEVDMSHLPRCF